MELLIISQNFSLTSLFDVCVRLISRVPYRLLSRLPLFARLKTDTIEAILEARVLRSDELIYNSYIRENGNDSVGACICNVNHRCHYGARREVIDGVLREFWVTDLSTNRRENFNW